MIQWRVSEKEFNQGESFFTVYFFFEKKINEPNGFFFWSSKIIFY